MNTSTEHYFETTSAEFRPNALKGGDYCASLTVADWSPVWNTTNLFLRCQRTGAEKGPSSWFKFVVYSNVQRPVTKLERQRIEFKPMQWKDLKSLNEALKNPHEGPSTMTGKSGTQSISFLGEERNAYPMLLNFKQLFWP